MTSTSSQPLLHDNETFSFMTTSSDLLNISYGNQSDTGLEFPCTKLSAFVRPAYTGIYGYIYLGVVLFLIVSGIVGNVLLFIMMTDKKVNFLSYSVYLKFLSVSDSTLLIIRLAQETQRLFSPELILHAYNSRWILYTIFQQIVRVLSPWLVVGLSLDRFVCVCFPLKRESVCTDRKATVICSILTGISVMMMIPTASLVSSAAPCMPSKSIQYYYIFVRLVISSTVPCFTILVLNVLIIKHIHQSYVFRNSFARSTRGACSNQQDKATRPLVLVSILAFVTLLPVSMSEAVEIPLQLFKSDSTALTLSKKLWPIFLIIYILNFGQNFYILIGSSSNYRDMIKRRLAFCCVKNNQTNTRNQAVDTTNMSYFSGSRSGTIASSVPSISSVNTSPSLDNDLSVYNDTSNVI